MNHSGMLPIKSKPLFIQVEEFIRQQIDSGDYPVHSKLPSARELATITGTSFCTVQTAISKLCKEGLLDSRVGRGTFVIGGKTKLACMGFYFRRPLSRSDSAFYQVLNREMRRKLTEAGIKVRVWSDERDEKEFPEPPRSLAQAMERREIQGLVAPLASTEDLVWLQKTPIPSSELTTDMVAKNGVGGDFRDMLHQGLQELRDQGCRSVGIINSMLLRKDCDRSAELDFYRSLVDQANEMGMEVRNEWVRFPAEYTPHFAHFGHEQFHALWDLKKRPEGLLVYPDEVVTGVITAILERRLKVPEDLKVVFHANDLVPYVCPFPATFLCTAVGGIADLLIGMVQAQLNGAEPAPAHIPISIVRNADPFRRVVAQPVTLS